VRQFGISAADIANIIQQRSIATPSGELNGEQEEIILRFADQRKTTAELEDLVVISGKTGAAIRLGDIATIHDQFEKDESK